MHPDDIARRADQARQILDNPLFGDTFDAIREDLRKQRMSVLASDKDGQMHLIVTEQILNSFETYLRRVIKEGEFAQAQQASKPKEVVFAR